MSVYFIFLCAICLDSQFDALNFWNYQSMNFVKNLCQTKSAVNSSIIEIDNSQVISQLRKDIINYFQEFLLLGDGLAAEYLLMNMISGT